MTRDPSRFGFALKVVCQSRVGEIARTGDTCASGAHVAELCRCRPLSLQAGRVLRTRPAACRRRGRGHGAMQRLDGQLVLSPTDLTHHQECRYLTRLDLGVAAGEWAAPDVEVTDELQLVFDRGIAHEEKYLASLEVEGRSVARIDTVCDADGRRRAEAQTVEAMRRGVDVVYQGAFFDGAWGGQADFLLRVEAPSVFG